MKPQLDDKVDFTYECLTLAFDNVLSRGDVIKEYKQAIPIEYMECIAQVRFGLCLASKMFYAYYCSEDVLQKLPSSTKEKLENLRQRVKSIITDGVLREPKDFLIKQFVRQYGFTYFDLLSKQEKFKEWIQSEQVYTSITYVNNS